MELEKNAPPFSQILKTIITHKFTSYDDETIQYILGLDLVI